MIALTGLFDRIKNLSPRARIVLSSCGGLFIIGVMIVTFTGLFWPTSHSASTRRDTTTTSTAQPSPLLFGTNLTLIDRHDQVLTSAATRDLLQRIHPESVRMPVRTDLPEAVEVQAAQIIKRLGAVPVVSLQGSLDPHVLSDDTAIITTMNKIFGTSVIYYEFGNEEDLVGVPADRYTTSWNAIVPLLKVLAPQAQFVGPVTYHADPSYLKSFLQKAQPRPDEVSWHEYTCTQADPETTCLSHLADWSTHLNTARSIMTAVMGRALPIMITEWNYAPNATPTDGKSNDNGFMSTWTQKALQTLIANHVFASMQYSCTNTPTALVSSTNTLTVQGAVFLAEAQRAVALTQHSNTPSLEPATATPTLPGSLTPIAATTPSNSATPPAPTVQPTATTALPTSQPSPSPSPTPTPTPVPPTPTPTPRSVLPTPTPTPRSVLPTQPVVPACGVVRLSDWIWNNSGEGDVEIIKVKNTCGAGLVSCQAIDQTFYGGFDGGGINLELDAYDSSGRFVASTSNFMVPFREHDVLWTLAMSGYSRYVCTPSLLMT